MEKTKATLYCSRPTAKSLIELGVPKDRIIPLDGKETFEFDDYSVEVFKTVHTKFGARVILSKLFNPRTYWGIGKFVIFMKNFPK